MVYFLKISVNVDILVILQWFSDSVVHLPMHWEPVFLMAYNGCFEVADEFRRIANSTRESSYEPALSRSLVWTVTASTHRVVRRWRYRSNASPLTCNNFKTIFAKFVTIWKWSLFLLFLIHILLNSTANRLMWDLISWANYNNDFYAISWHQRRYLGVL